MWSRKISLLLFFIFFTVFSLFGIVQAEDLVLCDAQGSATDLLANCSADSNPFPDMGEGTTGVENMVKNIATKAFGFAALFAIGAIVWSGVQYTTSYGDDEKVKKAKSTAIFALIGLILALTSFSLVNILVNFIYNF